MNQVRAFYEWAAGILNRSIERLLDMIVGK